MSEQLSILHVVRSPVGGIFRHIADLAAAQREAGHCVGLVCDSLTGGALEEDRIATLAPLLAHGIVRLPMPRAIGTGDILASLAVARQAARLCPDIIHAHGAKGGVFGRLAATMERRRGRKVASFYAPHGGSLHFEKRSASGRLYFAVERALERLTDGLIHVSAYEAETYGKKVGPPRCPAHIVLNGLRPEEFWPVAHDADPADFLYIGMLRDLKGVDVFLDALAHLKGEGAALRALVVGAGEPADERRYRDMAASAGLADAVTFLPPMPARRAFAMAKTVIVPSRAESMPYLVLEAAAAGVPIVATRVGGIPEILSAATERLVRPGDAVALAAEMRLALADPERLAREAELRRQRMTQKFSLSSMAGQVEAIYRDALEAYRERPGSPALKAGFSR